MLVVKPDAPFTTSEQVITPGHPIATAQGSAPEAALQNAGGTVQSIDNYTESQTQADPTLKLSSRARRSTRPPRTTACRTASTRGRCRRSTPATQKARTNGELANVYADMDYFEVENLPTNLVEQ